MALKIAEKYPLREQSNRFYRRHHRHIALMLFGIVLILLLLLFLLLYQIFHRPMPVFYGVTPDKEKMTLTPFTEPNLLSDTLVRWASKAATMAYTFNFVNYNKQIAQVRSYFTPAGWADYIKSVSPVVDTIIANQLFVNGVVYGAPVIAHQGVLGKRYAWQLQIPFLVTYQSASATQKRNFLVLITIVKVPTTENPQGIGIDRFVMRG